MQCSLFEADAENAAFHRIIESVRHDLAETERLLALDSVRRSLNSTPEKLPYIRRVVLNTKTALENVERSSERSSTNWREDTITLFDIGLLPDDGAFTAHHSEVSTCHQALCTVLAFLAPLERLSTIQQARPPGYQDATYFDDVLSHRQMRELQHEATTNSSLSSTSIYKLPMLQRYIAPSALSADRANAYQRESVEPISHQEEVKSKQAEFWQEALFDKAILIEEGVGATALPPTFSLLIQKTESEFKKAKPEHQTSASIMMNDLNPGADQALSNYYGRSKTNFQQDHPDFKLRNLSATNLLGPINSFDFSSFRDPLLLFDTEYLETKHDPQDTQKSRQDHGKRYGDIKKLPAGLDGEPGRPRNNPPSGALIFELPSDSVPPAPPVALQRSLDTPINMRQWQPYRKQTQQDVPHTIESSQNPPPEVVIPSTSLPLSTHHGPPPEKPKLRQTYKSLTSWPSMQFYSQQPDQSFTSYHQTYPTKDLYPEIASPNSNSVTSTPASTFSTVSSVSQASRRDLPESYRPSSTVPNSPLRIPPIAVSDVSEKKMSSEHSLTVAEGRRNNRRVLLNLMAKGNG
jgi:hypothetical protein